MKSQVSTFQIQWKRTTSELKKSHDKEMIAKLNYEDIEFLVSRKSYFEIETKNTAINVVEYENKQEYLIYLLKYNLEHMKLLLLENKDNFEDHVRLLFPENEKKSEYISVTSCNFFLQSIRTYTLV